MFVPLPVVIGAGLLIAMLLVLLARRRGPGRDLMAPPKRMQPRPTAIQPASAGGAAPLVLSPQQEAEIRALLANGRLIDAIKRVREIGKISLKEAKDLVDRFE